MNECICGNERIAGECAACNDEFCADCLFGSEYHDELICETCRENEVEMHLYYEDYTVRSDKYLSRLNLTFKGGKKMRVEIPAWLCQGRLYNIALKIGHETMPWIKILAGEINMPQEGVTVK